MLPLQLDSAVAFEEVVRQGTPIFSGTFAQSYGNSTIDPNTITRTILLSPPPPPDFLEPVAEAVSSAVRNIALVSFVQGIVLWVFAMATV